MNMMIQALSQRANPLFGALNPAQKQELSDAYRQKKLAFMDVDTQVHFFKFTAPRVGLPVPGALDIVPLVKRLTDMARQYVIPMIATMDSHRKNDKEFKHFKAVSDQHCVKGTPGWLKIPESVLSPKAWVIALSQRRKDVPSELDFRRHANAGNPFHLEKPSISFLSNPKSRELIRNSGANTFVVYGLATDFCVKEAVRGLKDINPASKVVVVEDAMRGVFCNDLKTPENEGVYDNVATTTVDELEGVLKDASAKAK